MEGVFITTATGKELEDQISLMDKRTIEWTMRASLGQAPTHATVAGQCEDAIELLGKYKELCEEIKRGDSYHLGRIEAAISVLTQADSQSVPVWEEEREAFKAAHRHLGLDEVPDAWGQPTFKHSHVEASWLGWIARAARAPADRVPYPISSEEQL